LKSLHFAHENLKTVLDKEVVNFLQRVDLTTLRSILIKLAKYANNRTDFANSTFFAEVEQEAQELFVNVECGMRIWNTDYFCFFFAYFF
jgi:hypothetical protein